MPPRVIPYSYIVYSNKRKKLSLTYILLLVPLWWLMAEWLEGGWCGPRDRLHNLYLREKKPYVWDTRE